MAILLNVRNGPDQSKCMMCVWWSYMCQKPFSARFCGAVVLNRTTNKLTCQNINNNCASSSELLNRFKSYYLDKDNLIILCMWQCMQAKPKVIHSLFQILRSSKIQFQCARLNLARFRMQNLAILSIQLKYEESLGKIQSQGSRNFARLYQLDLASRERFKKREIWGNVVATQ